jgi:hypothetical protein
MWAVITFAGDKCSELEENRTVDTCKNLRSVLTFYGTSFCVLSVDKSKGVTARDGEITQTDRGRWTLDRSVAALLQEML